MPLVIAAVKAAAEPAFDLSELQATTHCTCTIDYRQWASQT
jgi:hypothetical protein